MKHSLLVKTTLIFMICATFGATVGINFYRLNRIAPHKTNTLHTLVTKKNNLLSHMVDSVGIYFWGKYRPTWHAGEQATPQEKKEQKKFFGYNLRIEHIIDQNSEHVINHKRPTLFFHGWGDKKDSAKLLKAFCDVIPGDVITFHFRDRGVIIPKLRHANLGQLPDVLTAIYALKWAKDRLHLDSIDLFGYSRGGAVTLNMLAVLNDKTGTYDEELMRIGVDNQERKTLLSLVENGCIVLNCPLTDMNVSLSERMQRYSNPTMRALTTLSHYKPHGLQGLTSSKLLDGLQLKMLVHFQHRDTIVSNKNEAHLYENLAKYNPKTTYLTLGNDGGHLHTHASLAHVLHTFKRMYGGSYDPAYDAQYQTTKHKDRFDKKLLQPVGRAESVISSYYNAVRMAEQNQDLKK